MGRVVLVAVVLLCLTCSVNAGAVRRDPVTGKWVDASDLPAAPDRRASQSVEGGDFFSGFTIVDNTKQDVAPSSLIPETPLQDTPVVTMDRPRRKSKYSVDLPVAENVQTEASASTNFPIYSDDASDENTLVQTTAQAQATLQAQANGQITEVEHVYHKFEPQEQIQVASTTLKVRTLGNVCRFQGVAPASGCPAEATNGCVDHIPCKLSCPSGGYFRWRCLGPQLVSPSAFAPPPEPEVLVPPPPQQDTTDDFVHDLAARIGKAIQNNDYTGLARAILQAKTTSGSSVANAHLALAVSQLSQMQQSSTAPSTTNTDVGAVLGDEDVAL